MSDQINSWNRILQNLLSPNIKRAIVLIYPPARLELAEYIDLAAKQLGFRTKKIEVYNHIKQDEKPVEFLDLIQNLKVEDVIIILRHNNFMKNLRFNRFFSYSSGFQYSQALVIILHMLIENKILTEFCDINYKETSNYAELLYSQLKGAKKIRLTTEIGTDLIFKPRKWSLMPISFENSKVLFLPVGQIYTAPFEEYTNGTIVIDKCVSEFPINFEESIAFPPIEEKIILKIENGRIVDIKGGNQAIFLEKNCLSRVSESGNTLGEITFGINPKDSEINNIGVQDILRGTVHFGFGMNTHLGGKTEANTHWDAVIKFDHKQIEILE